MNKDECIFSKSLNEECGVFGVYNNKNASELAYYGLHSLQHRGQEACGIVSSDTNKLYRYKGEGLVHKVFGADIMKSLVGTHAIGHVRYSTTGGGGIENVQPYLFHHSNGDFSLAHNGNIVNSKELKRELELKGSLFQSSSDTEILAHLLMEQGSEITLDSIKYAVSRLEGAFAFLILTSDKMYIIRDKNGLRPVSISTFNDSYIVSSETCAFDVVGSTYLRDVKPAEIVTITKEDIQSDFYTCDTKLKICAMEYIYFSRPDSSIHDLNVHTSRKEAGKVLYQESHVEADIVIGVPDSSISAAIGYSEASGIPYEIGLVKSKYIGRTFIQPSQELRDRGVRMKLSAVSSIVKDKRVILLDDSIVRGTTMKRIISMLKKAGATEVHVRIASPPIKHPCFYGVDTSTYEELIGARHTIQEIQEIIKADSLYYISEKGLCKSCTDQVCLACFNKDYPTELFSNLK